MHGTSCLAQRIMNLLLADSVLIMNIVLFQQSPSQLGDGAREKQARASSRIKLKVNKSASKLHTQQPPRPQQQQQQSHQPQAIASPLSFHPPYGEQPPPHQQPPPPHPMLCARQHELPPLPPPPSPNGLFLPPPPNIPFSFKSTSLSSSSPQSQQLSLDHGFGTFQPSEHDSTLPPLSPLNLGIAQHLIFPLSIPSPHTPFLPPNGSPSIHAVYSAFRADQTPNRDPFCSSSSNTIGTTHLHLPLTPDSPPLFFSNIFSPHTNRVLSEWLPSGLPQCRQDLSSTFNLLTR